MYIPGLYRFKKLIKKYRLGAIQHKMDINPINNILLFSDPRGGSTWLTEVLIKHFSKHAILWEPLHIDHVTAFKELGFTWRQYIPQEEVWPEAQTLFKRVFQGKVLNEWTGLATSSKELLNAKGLFVKFCRGNALLPWAVKHFKFDYQPVYLIRHPFAVAASQMKQGGWDAEFKGFEIPTGPYAEYIQKHESFLKQLKFKDESLVAKKASCVFLKLGA